MVFEKGVHRSPRFWHLNKPLSLCTSACLTSSAFVAAGSCTHVLGCTCTIASGLVEWNTFLSLFKLQLWGVPWYSSLLYSLTKEKTEGEEEYIGRGEGSKKIKKGKEDV